MTRMLRVLLTAVAALCTLAFAATTATATTPDPYNTSTGSGTLATDSVTGISSCEIFNITGNLAGGSGTITAISDRNCRGVLTDILSILPITVLVDLNTRPATVTVHIAGVTIRNILFGSCLYTGLLIGTGSGSGVHVEGNLTLNSSRSSGLCTPDADVILLVNFPGLSFDL